MTLERHEEIKESLQELKTTIGVAKSKIKETKATLLEEYDVKTLAAAEALYDTIGKDIDTLKTKESKVEKDIDKLLEKMEDDDEDED